MSMVKMNGRLKRQHALGSGALLIASFVTFFAMATKLSAGQFALCGLLLILQCLITRVTLEYADQPLDERQWNDLKRIAWRVSALYSGGFAVVLIGVGGLVASVVMVAAKFWPDVMGFEPILMEVALSIILFGGGGAQLIMNSGRIYPFYLAGASPDVPGYLPAEISIAGLAEAVHLAFWAAFCAIAFEAVPLPFLSPQSLTTPESATLGACAGLATWLWMLGGLLLKRQQSF